MTVFAFETWELMREVIETAGDKRTADSLGVSRTHVHRQARHPMDADDPDGTGQRNHLDRTEALIEMLAMRGERARPLLRILRLWHDELFERALERGEVGSLTGEKAGITTIKYGEFLTSCSSADAKRIVKDGAEVIEMVERVMRAAKQYEAAVPIRQAK